MALPLTLVLVRHGESEGNLANHRSRSEDEYQASPDFQLRPSRDWRLTDRGRNQALAAKVWLRTNNYTVFDRYYTSTYVRAKETAALLELPNARWYKELQLRERDAGLLDSLSDRERSEKFAEYVAAAKRSPFVLAAPGGESPAALYTRLRTGIVDTLHRECSESQVIAVCHGEVMRGLRLIFERFGEEYYQELGRYDHEEHLHNCQILAYSRIDPTDPTIVSTHYRHLRSVCPWDETRSSNIWQPITRHASTNEDLLREVLSVPQLVNQ